MNINIKAETDYKILKKEEFPNLCKKTDVNDL